MRVALLLLSICALAGTKKAAKSLVTPVTDQKEFKKLLRTKTNVMVLFTGNAKKAGEAASVMGEVRAGNLKSDIFCPFEGEQRGEGACHVPCHRL